MQKQIFNNFSTNWVSLKVTAQETVAVMADFKFLLICKEVNNISRIFRVLKTIQSFLKSMKG